jgi:hypothetical protein
LIAFNESLGIDLHDPFQSGIRDVFQRRAARECHGQLKFRKNVLDHLTNTVFPDGKAVEKTPSITKPRPRAKAEPGGKKGVEAELARERRRAQQVGKQKGSSSCPDRSEKQRSGPGR